MDLNRIMFFKEALYLKSVKCNSLKECMELAKKNHVNADNFIIFDVISRHQKTSPIIGELQKNGHIDWKRESIQ